MSHEATKLFCDCFEEVESGFGVNSKFCKCVPFSGLVQKPEQRPIEWFGEEAFEYWDGTLAEMSVNMRRAIPAMSDMDAHLENVLEIASGEFFHLRDIVVKVANRKSAKRWNLAKPV